MGSYKQDLMHEHNLTTNNMVQLHVLFFPFMANGHMIPTLNMAKLFASRGVKSTIITTPRNAHIFENAVERARHLGREIALRIIKFPTIEAGLPEGCENAGEITSELVPKFFKAISMLQETLERVLEEIQPDCLVADMFFPWATDVASKLGIPRLVFHGISFFALCATANMRLHRPFRNVSSDTELFVVPHLPHKIKMNRLQLAQSEIECEAPTGLLAVLHSQIKQSELASFGVIVNSFYELEPDYARYYREVLKRKAWHVGPLSLCSEEFGDKIGRGRKAAIDEHECLKWLDLKKANSVIYVCFGSLAKLATSQLYEIAMGLEASDQEFIWVVGKRESEQENEKWLPEGFEDRIAGKSLIIRGWAPQVLILDHEAIGGFVTHCGWNSVIEGICAGLPMVTWPGMAEQFYNEKLVTEILKIGVPVGAQAWSLGPREGVSRGSIETAVRKIMVGEEAEEMRMRAKELKEMARNAVKEGGSSYNDLNALIEELSLHSSC